MIYNGVRVKSRTVKAPNWKHARTTWVFRHDLEGSELRSYGNLVSVREEYRMWIKKHQGNQ